MKKFFCCREHKTDYVAERTFCSVCGESMKGHGFSLNNSGPFYCSPECAEKGRWGIARANGQIKKCEYCGKEFINKKKEGGYFCCNDCYRAAVKEGWRSPKKPQVSNVIRNCTCVVCGRTVEMECDPDNLVSAFGFTCSDECRKKYDELKSLKTKKATKPVVQKRTEIKKDLDSITTALCADCRVSYKDCVRMQTQFRVLPKGAHYNNKGVLVICPDYLPPRRKGA